MQTRDGLLKRRALPTLLGLTLLGCAASAPTFAQNDRDRKMHHSANRGDDDMMWDPAPLAYPQAAPGGLHLYHWKDYTQTEMEPGSVPDKRWEIRHKKDAKHRDRMTYYRRTLDNENKSDSSPAAGYDMNWNNSDMSGYSTENYAADRFTSDPYTMDPESSAWIGSPWDMSRTNDVLLWPDQPGTSSNQDFVYILRGDTIYQIRTDNMSQTAQNSLPWLNSQPDYEQPLTEDMDVYNKAYSGIPIPENSDIAQYNSVGRVSDDPTTLSQNNENSDLTSRVLFHRSPGDTRAISGRSMKAATITASGGYVYVLRGNTLYQLRVSDLSLVNQKELPASGGGSNANSDSGIKTSNP